MYKLTEGKFTVPLMLAVIALIKTCNAMMMLLATCLHSRYPIQVILNICNSNLELHE